MNVEAIQREISRERKQLERRGLTDFQRRNIQGRIDRLTGQLEREERRLAETLQRQGYAVTRR